jgi:uracil-DNA glycosylase
MDAGANSGFEEQLAAEQIAGALDWWREAGVDYVYRDDPRQWIASVAAPEPVTMAEQRPAAPRTPPPPPSPLASAQARADWPTDLAAFADWWLAEPWLDAGRTQGRIAPRGLAGARLMVLVPQPEAEDRGELLSGPQGRLLAAMLGAMGISAAETYVASALPRYTPAADWAEIGTRGLGEVLRHHIALAAPQRVVALGDTILPLLGNDLTNMTAPLTRIAVGDDAIPALPLRSLEALLTRPAWKADVWRKWLAWTQ